MSNNALGAVNQQGSSDMNRNPSETTRRTPLSQEATIAYLQGALHDGTFSSNKRFRFSQKGRKWLERLRGLFSDLGKNSWIYREGKERDVFVLETLADFLDFHLDPLKLHSVGAQKSYIRGFFDAEGGIPHSKSARFYIQLVQKDKKKLDRLKQILAQLRIRCGKIHNPSYRVDPDYWRMYILRQSQKDFIRKIGSWHPRKIKILEKREMI